MTELHGPCSRGRPCPSIPVAGLLTVLAAIFCGPASAQIPDEFTNLRHFPEDIARADLIENMRQFSFALGVRCQYCHAGGDGISFEGVDFASDEKPEKRRARYMLALTDTVNSRLLPGVPERREPHVRVECRTCHRGLARPEMIDDILRREIATNGVDAAVARYDELREREYGGWSYDFGQWEINDLAGEYVDSEPETAAALMRMNVTYYPESVSAWVMLAEAELADGERSAAIAAYRQALALDPDNRRILDALSELGIDP